MSWASIMSASAPTSWACWARATLPSYADLPQLAAALRTQIQADEIAKLLGGNYRRVFEACLG